MHTTILETIEASLEAQLHAIRSLHEKYARPAKLKPERRPSNICIVAAVLAQAQGPLHITEIVHRAQLLFGRTLDRDSMVSAISKQILQKERFLRTAPNTFTLREGSGEEGGRHVT